MKLWVVCYDISNNRRLRKVASIMKKYGERVQKSVFECWINDENLESMLNETKAVMKFPGDNFRCYYLCKSCRHYSTTKTKTEISEPAKYFIV